MNKTKEVYIDNAENTVSSALTVADEFIEQLALDRKKSIHLRLLAEETLGMVKAMTGEFQAMFWMEAKDEEYRIRLSVKTSMSREKKNDLLSVSKSGKNAAVKGFMGKVREIIENGLLNFDEALEMQQEFGDGFVDYAFVGMGIPGELPMTVPFKRESLIWSLSTYRETLEEEHVKPSTAEAWDELEKSIVASIAKDVIVGVKKDSVDMTIIA